MTDEQEQRLCAPLDVTTGLAWMGFANEAIRQQVAPVLRALVPQDRVTDDIS